MKIVVFQLVLVFALAIQSYSQDKSHAIKVGQFDDKKQPISDLIKSFEIFFERLRNEAPTTRGYVTLASREYETRLKLADIAKGIVSNTKEKKRVELVGDVCFYGDQFRMIEFWLIPNGANEPYRAYSCDAMCPTLELFGKPTVNDTKETLYFTASISGDRSYHWFVKGGTIVEGKGTPAITVRSHSRVKEVTATLKIGRLPVGGNCLDGGSYTTQLQSK